MQLGNEAARMQNAFYIQLKVKKVKGWTEFILLKS